MGKIDRNNMEDLLKQVGFVEATICEVNRQISKIDIELERIPRRINHLEKMKAGKIAMISKKHKYLNELENNIKNLK